MKVLPQPDGPHRKTFLPDSIYFCNRFISLSCIEIYLFFFSFFTITKESMSGDEDDLTNQALDIILDNDILQKRVIDPLKKKITPYILCIGFFNLTMFIMIAYLSNRLSSIL